MSHPDNNNNNNQDKRSVRQRSLDDLARTIDPMDQSTFPMIQPKIMYLDELKDPNIPRRGTRVESTCNNWRIKKPKWQSSVLFL